MSYYWIIGFIIIGILLYYLYYYTLRAPQVLNLVDSAKNKIPEDQIENPDSNNYTYSMWIYVKKLNGVGNTNIFTYGNDISLNIIPDTYLNFSGKTVTEYFPLEQWIFVIICANGNIFDFYLDGKLVKTIQYNNIVSIPENKEILLGNNNTDANIKLANFKRISTTMTHYEVYREYEKSKYIKNYYNSNYSLEIVTQP